MKAYRTKRIYRVRCKSGLMGWRTRLQNNYAGYPDFVSYDIQLNLSQRLGFESSWSAWNSNPIIEGSVQPSDFRKATGKAVQS